ncbi:DUF6732 family protein [Aestuariibius sp. HNIBRBA575]|uniref:DUF6732 family protein n=1 Tax=Aestuariibius sp. HNIBRBA575 TaxID=3233343 RepID=UPI0034A0F37F
MRYALTVLFTTLAGGAYAHPGHLIELAGHDHWVAGGAIGAAILAGLWGALKGKKPEESEEIDAEAEEIEELEGAEA